MKPAAAIALALAVAACGDDHATALATDAPAPAQCRSFAPPAPIAFAPRNDGFAPLASVAIPQPSGGDIVDFDAAARLGKLLFWDVQVSSDGAVACASCHFSAGADARLFNAVNPGPDGVYASGGVTGPGQTATLADITTDDRFASEGVVARYFLGVPAATTDDHDVCGPVTPAPFAGQRQVTPRNAPSIFNAVYARVVFWDGRASAEFDGVDPFGGTANAGSGSGSGGAAAVAITGAPLASQAVAPIVNDVEMSCSGRPIDGAAGIGAKLLARAPLAYQVVAPDDGALACMSAAPATGVRCGDACTYADLFAAAFGSELAGDPTTAASHFGRLFGQAIAAYESTLIADQTPFDRYLLGDGSAMTLSQQQGMHAFADRGCTHCHAGAELSDASASFAAAHGALNVDGGDQGFHDTGVRPTSEDLGRATLGPNGASYSQSGSAADVGAFKTEQLRGVGLTAPYFHNGGKATLSDVAEFYARGGDFPHSATQLVAFTFLPGEEAALVDFLQNALTDPRVMHAQAPFDHPSLIVPDGPTLPAVGAGGM